MKVRYRSNNSGGRWWLKDEDWKALEAAGWSVEWSKNEEWKDADGIRWLGALAVAATSPDVESVDAAIAEWERVTSQDASEEGCRCCGSPHGFYEADPS